MTAAPWSLSVVQAVELIKTKRLKPSELAESALERYRVVEPLVHAFVSVDEDRVMRDAKAQDGHSGGPLHGIPVAIKDIFDINGSKTGCGSKAMQDAPPATRDSAAVARLRAAGAIIFGKTTTHELACGVYTPPTRNPWDLERSAGGSSGGTGASVAAGIVAGGIGSDTGGSIRIPASHCGLVGLKPTYARISRAGALTLSWSLDHVGTLTRTVADAALMLSVLAGPDPADPTTIGRPPVPGPNIPDDGVRGMRIAILRGSPFDPIEDEMEDALKSVAAHIRAAGADVSDATLPELEAGLAAEFSIVAAEAASYHEARMPISAALIGEDVRGLLETGLLLPAALYLRAQRTRRVIQEAFKTLFRERGLDAVIAPTVPAKAQRVDQMEYQYDGTSEPVITGLVRTTAPFNLSGLPTVAVPSGIGASGFPTSVQIATRPFAEQTALRIAQEVQRAAGSVFIPKGLETALKT